MKRITADMFQFDSGTVREKTPEDILSKIMELSKNDPHKYRLDAQRANLMIIRRLATKLFRGGV